MSRLSLFPVVALFVMMAFVSGALADCGFDHGGSTSSSTFTAQTAPSPPSPGTLAMSVLIPVAVLVGALAVVRRDQPAAISSRTEGRWVATPTQWLWVEDRK